MAGEDASNSFIIVGDDGGEFAAISCGDGMREVIEISSETKFGEPGLE